MSTTDTELRGLSTVRMGKNELLKRIKTNRDEHRKIYEEAMEGWKRSVIDALDAAYKDALEGKAYRVAFRLEQPEDHTDEYDTVIELLEASLDDEFELTYTHFSNYVLDKWGWQDHFLGTASSYGSHTAMSKDKV
jgi:hypothetical protein